MTDALIGIFIGYQLLHAFTQESISTTTLYESCLWGILYLLARIGSALNSRVLFWITGGIIASGIIQSILAILQAAGVFQSNHHLFAVTGSFANPGPLGGYIALGCALSIAALFINRKEMSKTKQTTLLISICITATACLLSDSRAAWMALLIACVWIIAEHFPKTRHIRMAILPLFFILLAGGLYFYRSASADGRLLIWKVSTRMIQDKLWFGHGVASFQSNYMNYQASYFEAGKYTAGETMLASDNTHAFNEFVRVTCEYGVTGFLLLLCIGFSLLSFGKQLNKINRVAICGLVAYVCFACFSYPSDVFPLKIILPLLIGSAVPVTAGRCYTFGLKAKAVLCSFIILLNGIAVKEWYYLHRIEAALSSYYFYEDIESENTLRQEFPHFKLNEQSTSKYAKTLFVKGIYKAAIPVLEEAIKLLPTAERYIDLGLAHQHTGDTEQAARCFKTASYMTPTHITPVYYLFSLHENTKQNSNARHYARLLIEMPVKKETSHTQNIRAEAKRYLEQKVL